MASAGSADREGAVSVAHSGDASRASRHHVDHLLERDCRITVDEMGDGQGKRSFQSGAFPGARESSGWSFVSGVWGAWSVAMQSMAPSYKPLRTAITSFARCAAADSL